MNVSTVFWAFMCKWFGLEFIKIFMRWKQVYVGKVDDLKSVS